MANHTHFKQNYFVSINRRPEYLELSFLPFEDFSALLEQAYNQAFQSRLPTSYHHHLEIYCTLDYPLHYLLFSETAGKDFEGYLAAISCGSSNNVEALLLFVYVTIALDQIMNKLRPMGIFEWHTPNEKLPSIFLFFFQQQCDLPNSEPRRNWLLIFASEQDLSNIFFINSKFHRDTYWPS